MYIAICDDQKMYVDELVRLIKQWQTEKGENIRLYCYDNAFKLLEDAEEIDFSAYFLDIMMPELDGMSAAKKIRIKNEKASIVFLTSHTGFAYESYSVHAMDYLLKPVKKERLFSILDKLLSHEKSLSDTVVLNVEGSIFRIPYYMISYVEVIGRHLYFNLTDGTVRKIKGTMIEYEHILLSKPEFAQVHRSYIVNMNHVEELSANSIVTFSGQHIPVSRLRYQDIKSKYVNLYFSKDMEEN